MPSAQIYEKLKELYPIYVKVKSGIILAEQFDPDENIYVAPFNELRSALDHVFKCFSEDPNLDYNFSELKEHLIRAGNDTFELLCSNLAIYITKAISPFEMNVINEVFPDYYRIHKPLIIDLQVELAHIRTHKKNSHPVSIDSFEEYFIRFEKLQFIYKETTIRIPVLIEVRDKLNKEREDIKSQKRKSTRNAYIIGIVITLLTGTLLVILTVWLTNKYGT